MLKKVLSRLPDSDRNHVAILSVGLDSTVLTTLLVERYGRDKVLALSFDYGQKQAYEVECARQSTRLLGIRHECLDLKVLGEIARPVSANISGTAVSMPKIADVLGDPQPVTYVPFRNLILLSLALARAESFGASHVYTGLQVHDEYGYWDTTQAFVDSINSVAAQNRQQTIRIVAPFSDLSKYEEIRLIEEMGKLPLLKHTLTCYNPNAAGESCGTCPSCAERIANFAKAGQVDPVPYQVDLNWGDLMTRLTEKRA